MRNKTTLPFITLSKKESEREATKTFLVYSDTPFTTIDNVVVNKLLVYASSIRNIRFAHNHNKGVATLVRNVSWGRRENRYKVWRIDCGLLSCYVIQVDVQNCPNHILEKHLESFLDGCTRGKCAPASGGLSAPYATGYGVHCDPAMIPPCYV